MFYWLMKYILAGPFIRCWYRPKASGIENIPTDGPVILAGNHLSFIDSVFMPVFVRRPVSFLAKSEYFTGKGIKGWATRIFMKMTGQLPIDRSGGKASEASLNTGLRVLGNGEILALYPEGTRSPDGRLYRGRTGIARMALEAGCPVVPIAMVGSNTAMPIGSKWPKRHPRIEVRFGEPLDFTRFHGMEGDRFVLRAVTDEIIESLRELGDQQYVDIYASSVRAKMAPATTHS